MVRAVLAAEASAKEELWRRARPTRGGKPGMGEEVREYSPGEGGGIPCVEEGGRERFAPGRFKEPKRLVEVLRAVGDSGRLLAWGLVGEEEY